MARSNRNSGFADELPDNIRNAREKARACASVDPAICLMCCISAAELILRDVSLRLRLPLEADEIEADGVRGRWLTAAELTKNLQKARRLPRDVASRFHDIRKSGNAAKHGWHGDERAASKALRCLDEVFEWYAPGSSATPSITTVERKKPRRRREPESRNTSGFFADKLAVASPISNAAPPYANVAPQPELNGNVLPAVTRPNPTFDLGIMAVVYLAPPLLALLVVSIAITPEAPAVVLGGPLLALVLGAIGIVASENESDWWGIVGMICLVLAIGLVFTAVYAAGDAVYQTVSANLWLIVGVAIAWTAVYGTICAVRARAFSKSIPGVTRQ